jgi:outer membrane protein assembly factor BamD
LALGDSYLSQKGTENYLLAASEFREFQTFYPTHPRADYAQLQLARSYAGQMLAPERDQSATRDTVKEVELFIQRYPNSALMSQARELERDAKDRLSQAAYRVGYFYFRSRWYPGAIDRFREILTNDPEFTRRDAVYYHLGESLYRTEKQAEALPYYERLLSEFEQSEFLVEAQRRVAELKGGTSAGK